MQFMGKMDDAVENGSEQIFLPHSKWENTTSIGVWDADNVEVKKKDEAAILAYGHAFGDTNRGKVMYMAGHDHGDDNDPENIAAQRAFFNFSFWSATFKAINASANISISFSLNVATPVTAFASGGAGDFTYEWSATCAGTFANPLAASTNFTPTVSGPCVITVKITDGCGRTSFVSESVVININPQPPVANNDTGSTSSCSSVTINVVDNDTDPEAGLLTVTSLGTSSNGTWVNNGTGFVTFTPNTGFTGIDVVNYTICDPTNLCDNATVTVTVNANIAPVANDDSETALIDAPKIIDVLVNDSDPDGGTLTINILTQPTNGTVSIEDDKILFQPNLGFSGITTFTYEVCDDACVPLCDPATVTVDVGCSPVANEANILGTVFFDQDGDGIIDGTEMGQDNVTVNLYVDVNMDGLVDASDTFVEAQTTDANGAYAFSLTNIPNSPAMSCIGVDQNEVPVAWRAANPSNRLESTIYDPLISTAADLSSGSGIGISTPSPSFNVSSINQPNLVGAISNNDYMEFNFSMNPSTDPFNFDKLRIRIPTGATNSNLGYQIAVIISADNFISSDILLQDQLVTGVANDIILYNFTNSDYALLAGNNYHVRIYFYNFSGMTAYIDDIHFRGGVCSNTPSFTEQTAVSTTADGAYHTYATDIDGDGDTDILSAALNGDEIAWYENDGNGNFTEQIISNTAGGAASVYAIDVDGDTDVLSASLNDDTIAWYENDGSENFTERIISSSANGAAFVYAIDVDGDGDIDVLGAHQNSSEIAWYENDGSENFTEQVISTTANTATSVYALDVDADGDIDILSSSFNDDKIAWYENDGSENFTERVISSTANGARSVYATDVDGDGDIDVLSASLNDSKIAWYENDGSENFTERVISTTAVAARSVYAIDLNGDGNTDVLSALSVSFNDDKIAWYENDGSANFTEHVISTAANGARSVYAADIDGDGVVDVISASSNDDKIAWYKSDLILSSGGNYVIEIDPATLPPGNATFTTDNVETASFTGLGEVDCSNNFGFDLANNPPVAVDDAETTEQNVPVDILVLDNDSDPDGDNINLVATLVSLPTQGGTVVLDENSTIGDAIDDFFTYTPGPNFAGQDTFSYSICDTGIPSLCDTAIVIITINAYFNDPPIAVDDVETTPMNTEICIDVLNNDSDPEGDNINPPVSFGTDASNGNTIQGGIAIIAANGTICYDPPTGFMGVDNFDYIICDPLGLCDTATVTITIGAPVNIPPIIVDDYTNACTNFPTNYNILNNDYDTDASIDVSSGIIITNASNGIATYNGDSTITYTSDPTFVGIDSITYQICDTGTPLPSLCDIAKVYFTVSNTNTIPSGIINMDTISINQPIYINVLDNDSDVENNNLFVTINTHPTNGTVSVQPNGLILYTPNADFLGNDSFTYDLCDDGCPSACSNGIVVNVNVFNRPPIAIDDYDSTEINTPVTINVLENDIEPDGGTIELISAGTEASNNTTNQGGILSIDDNGTPLDATDDQIIYTPLTGYLGVDTFTYRICDQQAIPLCDTAFVFVTIVPVEICGNGLDDDGDGDIDCDDSDCIITTSPATLTTCDAYNETGIGNFFLHEANPIVSVASGVIISYHASLVDAQSGSNSLVSPYMSNAKIIFVRVESLSSGCYGTNSITLIVDGKCLENCDNGKDEDGDGLIDCDDPDCSCCKAKAPTIILKK
ncbi:MAG: Ig-like domain-containing protein [Saprospiraceae bacterium]